MTRRAVWLSLMMLALIVSGCMTKPLGPPRFEKGDMCIVALTGERVMVVKSWRWKFESKHRDWHYTCRTAGNKIKHTRRDGLVSADTVTDVVRYGLVEFHEFELREE